MTLQQIRYITAVADAGSIGEGAKRLDVPQSGLSKAIHDPEGEPGITPFAVRREAFP